MLEEDDFMDCAAAPPSPGATSSPIESPASSPGPAASDIGAPSAVHTVRKRHSTESSPVASSERKHRKSVSFNIDATRAKQPDNLSHSFNAPPKLINSPLAQDENVTTAKVNNHSTLTEGPSYVDNNRYDSYSLSPFIVFLDRLRPAIMLTSDSQACTDKQLSIVGLGKRLFHADNNIFQDSFDLKSKGRDKFSICFTSYDKANLCVDLFHRMADNTIVGQQWHAYIPNFKVVRQFILRGIDESEEPSDICGLLRPPPDWCSHWTPPFEVSHLKKRIRSTSDVQPSQDQPSASVNGTQTASYVLVDTPFYIAKFRTIHVPTSLIYMSKRIYLDPLVPKVRRCNICQRFGHLAQFCRSGLHPDKAICARCGEKGHPRDSCDGSPRCINCVRARRDSTDHEASSGTCPSFLREKGIKTIMARHNVLRLEAEDIYNEFDGVPRRGWTPPSVYAPPLLVLGDFIPTRTATAPSFARAASSVPPASSGSLHRPVSSGSSYRHSHRDHGWPPIIPHSLLTSKSRCPDLSATFVSGNLPPPSPSPSALPSPRSSRTPLHFHGNYNSTQFSHFTGHPRLYNSPSSTRDSPPFTSLKTATLLPLVKSKFAEKLATNIQLSDSFVLNLIATICDVFVNP